MASTQTQADEPSLLERLTGHRLLGQAPREELSWLAEHGRLRRLQTGETLSSPALGPVRELFIVLSGRVGMYLPRAGVPRKVIEWTGGDATGLLPYSRLGKPPGTSRAEEPTDLLVVQGDDLRELARECHEVTTKLVGLMLDRARHFQQDSLHDARMRRWGGSRRAWPTSWTTRLRRWSGARSC